MNRSSQKGVELERGFENPQKAKRKETLKEDQRFKNESTRKDGLKWVLKFSIEFRLLLNFSCQ